MKKVTLETRARKYSESLQSSWLDNHLTMGITYENMERLFTRQQLDKFHNHKFVQGDFDTERDEHFYYVDDVVSFIEGYL